MARDTNPPMSRFTRPTHLSECAYLIRTAKTRDVGPPYPSNGPPPHLLTLERAGVALDKLDIAEICICRSTFSPNFGRDQDWRRASRRFERAMLWWSGQGFRVRIKTSKPRDHLSLRLPLLLLRILAGLAVSDDLPVLDDQTGKLSRVTGMEFSTQSNPLADEIVSIAQLRHHLSALQ